MDIDLNHSGEMIEDLLGNDREMTVELWKAMKKDAKARFVLTAIVGGLIGIIGISFLFVAFIPGIVSLWMMGMAVGMVLGGAFGMLFSMPVSDSVRLHLRVMDYVDKVIKNTDYKNRNLMDAPKEEDTIELSSDPVGEDDEEEEEDGEEMEEEEGTDETGEGDAAPEDEGRAGRSL